jgi:hypothetical protein
MCSSSARILAPPPCCPSTPGAAHNVLRSPLHGRFVTRISATIRVRSRVLQLCRHSPTSPPTGCTPSAPPLTRRQETPTAPAGRISHDGDVFCDNNLRPSSGARSRTNTRSANSTLPAPSSCGRAPPQTLPVTAPARSLCEQQRSRRCRRIDWIGSVTSGSGRHVRPEQEATTVGQSVKNSWLGTNSPPGRVAAPPISSRTTQPHGEELYWISGVSLANSCWTTE